MHIYTNPGFADWLRCLVRASTFVDRFVATSKTAQWSFAFYLLALLFNYPHFMATAYRTYRSYDELTSYRFYTIHVAVHSGSRALL